MVDSLTGKRVVVMGLGRFGGGVGVTRWLCRQGARVTVTDLAGRDQLTESLVQLDGLDVAFRLGGHDPADLDNCDLLVVNPAVSDDSDFLQAARMKNIPLTTEINLFLERCPAKVIGITGSVGKSTTTAMAGAILSTAFRTLIGGNIGKSLLEELADGAIGYDDLIVLELSSFQLAYFPLMAKSPHVALVTNLQANHLDRHGTMEAYGEAKKNIFRYQTPADTLILNADDDITSAWSREAVGRCEMFSISSDRPFDLVVPGEHNQQNAQAAWAIGRNLGISREAAQEALWSFSGLPHRLAYVFEKNGVRYYDDSKATTPLGAAVAVRSFPAGKVVAIAGGYDKHISLDVMCSALAQHCRAVVTTGQVGGQVAEGVRRCARDGVGPVIASAEHFDDAVAAAVRLAERGDVVLLSPGCASYDQFPNYIQRGLRFAQLVRGS